MEKKAKYDHAELEFVYLHEEDVISTSTELGESGVDNSGWTKPNDDKW